MAESYIDIWVGSNNITSSWFDSSIVSDVYQTNPDDYDQTNKIFRLILNRSATSLSGMFKDKTYVYRANIYLEEDSRVTDLSYMFDGCHQFERCGGYVKSPVTTTAGMFRGCASYSEADSPSFTVSLPDTILDMSSMFYNIYYLTACPSCINSNCTKNVTNMVNMFGHCWNFKTSSRLESLDVSSCLNFNSMLAYGTSASNKPSFGEVNLSKWKIREDATTDYMFRGANVTRVYFPPMKTYGKSIFQYNPNIAAVDMCSVVAPTISEYAFESYPTGKTLFVPKGSENEYLQSDWSKLVNDYRWDIRSGNSVNGVSYSLEIIPSVLYVRDTGVLTAQVTTYVNDTVYSQDIVNTATWISSNPNVSVFNGIVSGSTNDTATITAIYGDLTATANVVVFVGLKYTSIICGGSPITHYIPTGSIIPFTLDWSPLNKGKYTSQIKFGVSGDYTSFWLKTNLDYGSGEYILRASFVDGGYEDIVISFPEDYTQTYLSYDNLDTKSWGYYVNSDSKLRLIPINAETYSESTTHSWIHFGDYYITFDPNPDDKPRMGDIFVETPDALIIFSIIQRPDEQSDFFLLPSSTGSTSVRSVSGKQIKRWWVLCDNELYYGTGDNTTFTVNPPSNTNPSVTVYLVVEDIDGKVWNNFCGGILLFQYGAPVNTSYWSKNFFDPYQSFVVNRQQGNVWYVNDVNQETYGYLPTINYNNYHYIKTPVVPFGCSLKAYNYNNGVYSTLGDISYTPVKLIEAPYKGDTVSVPFETTASDPYVITSDGVTYSVSNKIAVIDENDTEMGMNKYIRILPNIIIPIVQYADIPLNVYWNASPAGSSNSDGTQWAVSLFYNIKPESFDVVYPSWTTLHYAQYDDYIQFMGEIEAIGGIVDRYGNISVILRFNKDGEIITVTEQNLIFQSGENYTFEPTSITISPEGETVTTTVTSQYPLTGYSSAISSITDVSFERVSDTEIELSATYPLATQQVTDTITLIGDSGFDNIPLTTVLQPKFDFTWEFNQENTILSTDSTPEYPSIDYVFGVVPYESSVNITDMTFSIDYLNGDDWITEITCDTNWKEVHIKAKDNRLGSLRRATITARSERYDAVREFDIVQNGLSLYVYPASATIGSNGGSVTFGLNDALSGWIGPDEIAISLDGLDVPFTYKQHFQTLEVTIQVSPNDSNQSRTLHYNIQAFTANPEVRVIYNVTQPAFEWNMLDSIWIDSTASTPTNQTAVLTDEFTYTSTDNLGTLDITFDADWIQATGQSWNDGTGTITITADDNRLGNLRRCVMTIYSPTYNKTKTVTIVQQGFSMRNQNSGYTIDCVGGEITLLASCNSWIGQDEISIKGQIDGTLVDLPFTINGGYITQNYTNVYVTLPSNAGLAREIEIQMHIRALGNYFIFNVDQPSCDINIDTPELHFEKEGGSREVYIEASGDWQIEVVGDWITVTPMNGSGDNVITIAVESNTVLSDRTGYVYITNGIDREAIVITQGHIIPELYFKERYIKMPLEGGTTYVTLISNIDWTTEWEIQ